MKIIAALGLSLAATSCEPARVASPLAPVSPVLAIVPAVDSIAIGASEKVTAILIEGGTSRRTVQPSWESDAPHIVGVNADGEIAGVTLGSATIRAVFDSLSARQQVMVVPDVHGTWRGRYRVVGCTRSGPGPDVCKYELAGGGVILPFGITLSQTGARVQGSMEFNDNTGALLHLGALHGTIGADGALGINASLRSIHTEGDVRITVSDWTTSLTADRAGMTGQFTKTRTFNNYWGPQQVKEECLILSLQRVAAQ